jgi:plastocyanin
MRKKKKSMALVVIALVVVFGTIVVALGSGQRAQSTGQQVGSVQNSQVNTGQQISNTYAAGDAQTVKMTASTGFYNPSEIRVKVGDTVRIDADPNTFFGCMTTFMIDGYNIKKYLSDTDHVIEFTADKAGTFWMHCPMGMGNGKLIVTDANGNAPAPAAKAPVATCGASGGGCGCGGAKRL